MKSIMYHYVRQFDDTLPFFRYLDFVNFQKQLDYFASEFGFVSQSEWNDSLSGSLVASASGKVILTFDDAMRCHYDFVFPELLKRNLWGVFYVPTSPYSDGVILDVHRIHLLCGAFSGSKLLGIAREIVREHMISGDKVQEFRNETYTRQVNFEGVTEFKRLLNYFVDYEYRSGVLDQIYDALKFSFDVEDFYVSRKNLGEMKSKGMIIGSHTHTHPVMSRLARDVQAIEIEKSFDVLGDLCDGKHKTYCHPYGGFHSFNADTISILASHGVSYAFNVEGREISSSDMVNSRLYLPRYDCNLFPHGKAS